MGKLKKTQAMRLLDQKKIKYDYFTYDVKDGLTDGISVADKVGVPHEQVYKTLVTVGNSKKNYVFVIPVEKHLNLKSAAARVLEKKLEMIPVKDILKTTGYVKGGCSPLAMKKQFDTYLDSDAKDLDYIVFSAGKIGLQIKMDPNELVEEFQIQWFSGE